MLAHNYVCDYQTMSVLRNDLEGWYVSEKLDGYRAIWRDGVLWSRTGHAFHAHPEFTASFPRGLILDGELFVGRDQFHRHGVLRKKDVQPGEWESEGVRFVVFDVVCDKPFSERLDILRALPSIPNLSVHEQTPVCEGAVTFRGERFGIYGPSGTAIDGPLMTKMRRIHAEGLMVRDPSGPYEPGKRSRLLLKIKPQYDAEGTVVGYVDGKGKHEGRLGALILEKDGKRFKCGTGFTDAQRENWTVQYPIGTRVTYGYFETTSTGLPRFPSFFRVRDETIETT